MSYKTTKGRVAASPFPDMSVKTKVEGTGAVKVARIENKVELVNLNIVFDSEDGRFRKGGCVLVKGNHFAQPWAKEVHEVALQKFILVPDNFVEAIGE